MLFCLQCSVLFYHILSLYIYISIYPIYLYMHIMCHMIFVDYHDLQWLVLFVSLSFMLSGVEQVGPAGFHHSTPSNIRESFQITVTTVCRSRPHRRSVCASPLASWTWAATASWGAGMSSQPWRPPPSRKWKCSVGQREQTIR